jgi:hypothetical protein
MFLYNGFTWYEDSSIKIDELAAINMTSIVGDKGKNAYQCQPAPSVRINFIFF